MFKKLVWITLFITILATLAGGGALYWLIALHPGDEIKPENINSILGKESPVFYNDGKTRLGVFFDQAHRQYVPYEEIPVNFINALIASEDSRFFSHFGFDVIGILRAAIKNIQSRKIVQGGSTLTQQTAKNLFKRQSRSLQAKLKELLFALRLEYHYPKEKIFEFYANQFYVSGNGHGLGVAARYYFDKKPEELNILQCAYIAGSVKRPNYYNPFIKKSEESTKKALERGRTRVNYVLAKMLELGMISEYQHGIAKFSDIEFKKGQVGYSLDYAMEMVKDAVTSAEVTEALEKVNISNIAVSGVRIITTINKNIQEKTLYSLRHDLSRLDVRLRGYEREEIQKELNELDYRGDTILRVGAFLFGTVEDIIGKGKATQIHINLGRRFGTGIIDRKGFARLVTARVRWQKTPWTEAREKDYTAFLAQLKAGDKVWVSVRGRSEDGQVLLDLEKFPKINGGALVLKDGIIRAVSGGVENRFFNRAIYARRTMGSSFKPFVYAAAMQLGWTGTDNLRNSRELFVFQNQPYFPRPDHYSPFEEVSMSWAGVHSENVASVWLVYHLCDKLTKEQFREVAAHVDLAPRIVDGEEEPYSRFRGRIRDKYGIVLNLDILRQAAFHLAQRNVETDLIFVGRDQDYRRLQRMHYGLGFDDFKEEIRLELEDEIKKPKKSKKKELQLRQNILANNFLDLESLHSEYIRFKLMLEQYARYADDPFSTSPEDLKIEMPQGDEEAWLYYDDFSERYCFSADQEKVAGMFPVEIPNLHRYLLELDADGRESFWSDVFLDANISVETFDLMQKQVERELEGLKQQLPYTMEVLHKIREFRVLVGLKYLIALAQEFGVNSDLEPVLSFPLGSNVVTLLETLRLYEGLTTGNTVRTGKYEDDNEDLLAIIDRIETTEGEVIYRPTRQKRKLLAGETVVSVGHILENVVKYGTGRYADKNIKLTGADLEKDTDDLNSLGLSIPVLGKTGTANRYTNASFFGFLPGLSPSKDSLSMNSGYVVGVYVGFDDNKEMRKGATKISGSAGALPIWSEIVNSIVEEEDYGADLDPVDLSFYGLTLKRQSIGQKNIAVAADQGGVLTMPTRDIDQLDRYRPSIIAFGKLSGEGDFIPTRQFLPFWKVAQTSTDATNK